MSVKLYFSPGSCAMSTHAFMAAANIPYELIAVSLQDHKVLKDGSDFLSVTPQGAVPAITTPDGRTYTQHAAICTFLTSIAPNKAFAITDHSSDRYLRIAEAVGFASDLQGSIGPLFRAQTDEAKAALQPNMDRRLAQLDAWLERNGHKFWLGDEPTYPDFEVAVILGWLDLFGIDKSQYKHVMKLKENVRALPAFQLAAKEEGL